MNPNLFPGTPDGAGRPQTVFELNVNDPGHPNQFGVNNNPNSIATYDPHPNIGVMGPNGVKIFNNIPSNWGVDLDHTDDDDTTAAKPRPVPIWGPNLIANNEAIDDHPLVHAIVVDQFRKALNL